MKPETTLPQLIDQAEERKLWLYTRYQDLWFSPGELRLANEEGYFRWGVINWQLRDPAEYLAKLEYAVKGAQQEVDNLRGRINKWRKL